LVCFYWVDNSRRCILAVDNVSVQKRKTDSCLFQLVYILFYFRFRGQLVNAENATSFIFVFSFQKVVRMKAIIFRQIPLKCTHVYAITNEISFKIM